MHVLLFVFKGTVKECFRTIELLSSIYTVVSLRYYSFQIVAHDSSLGLIYCDTFMLRCPFPAKYAHPTTTFIVAKLVQKH